MATFTTISVLGGSQTMPEWMFGQEAGLESLRTKELESGDEGPILGESSVKMPEKQADVGVDGADTEKESRMIDMPFDIFGDD